MADDIIGGQLVDSGTYYTPESIKQKRKLAEAMLMQGLSAEPIRSGWQGAARLAQAMLGGYDIHKADQDEKDAAKAQSDSMRTLLGLPPSAPTSLSASNATGPTPSSGEPKPDQKAMLGQIKDYWVKQGYTPTQAAAMAGNMVWESGGSTSNVTAGDNWRNSPRSPHSAGLGQWNDRLPALAAYAKSQGIDIGDVNFVDAKSVKAMISKIPMEVQLGFAKTELDGPEGRANAMIKAAPDDLMAANKGAISYHRPAGWTWNNPAGGHAFDRRMALAQAALGLPPPAAQVADASGKTVPQDIGQGPEPLVPGVSRPGTEAPPEAPAAPPAAGPPMPQAGPQSAPAAAPGGFSSQQAPPAGAPPSPQSILADSRIDPVMRQRLGALLSNPATAPLAMKIIQTSILPSLLSPKNTDWELKETVDNQGEKQTVWFNKVSGSTAPFRAGMAPPGSGAPAPGAPGVSGTPQRGTEAPNSIYTIPQAPEGANKAEFAKAAATNVAKEQASDRDKATGAIEFLSQAEQARKLIKEKGDVIGRYASPGEEDKGVAGVGAEGFHVPVPRGFFSAPLATTLKTARDLMGNVPTVDTMWGGDTRNIYAHENAKRDELDQMMTKLAQAGLKSTYGSRVTNIDVQQQQKTVPHLTDTDSKVSLDKIDNIEKQSWRNIQSAIRDGLINIKAIPPEILLRGIKEGHLKFGGE